MIRLPIAKGCMSHGKKAWFLHHVNDQYVKKAQELGFRSRASFKLLQIQQKFTILHQASKYLDLGAAPGSWSQAIKTINPTAQIAAVDLLSMKEIEGVDFYQSDARNKRLHDLLRSKYQYFDAIVSDMAPNFSGTLFQTHSEAVELNRCCLELSLTLGSPSCSLIMKTVEGQYQKALVWVLEYFYGKVFRFKPKSSRSQSAEHYLVCKDKKDKDFSSMLGNMRSLQMRSIKRKSDVEQMMGKEDI